jgi:hypothetical protein
MNARWKSAPEAGAPWLSRFARELARVFAHPASFCIAATLLALGNGVAHGVGLGARRQAELHPLSASTLALGTSVLAAVRRKGDKEAFWGTLRP